MADDKKKKDDDEEATPEVVAVAPAGKSKLGLILGALALVVVSAGAPTAFFMLKANKVATAQLAADAAAGAEALAREGQDDTDQLGDDEERLGAILPLDTFLVNLDGGRYLRAQVQLEFVTPAIPPVYARHQVVIRDGLISLMSRKKPEDLGTSKGRDGMKSEIRDLINEILKREEVKRVFFTQFVIQ